MTTRSILAWLFVASLLLAGCGTARIEKGRRVDPRLLETNLRLGKSTRADVLAALGEPNGRGRGLLPIDPTPKTVWSYFYEEATIEAFADFPNSDLKDYRRLLLCVYFDGDRYDGYLWFSSLLK